ncbi:outer envelope membrane protein 7 [Senna tora]|uniref:Outer envelope membrane protein 7 n=1 Tax=Senna tora TaxID=362788 RepID=A0A834SII3_9FABA|nr:outer envelope membrane protein 7 [Senna tora]
MGAVTTAVIAIVGVILGWITIEIACKPCLDKGREAIDRNLNPDYDPDDEDNDIRAPLNPSLPPTISDPDSGSSAAAVKSV